MRKLLLRDVPIFFAVAYVTATFVDGVGTLWQPIGEWLCSHLALVSRLLVVHLIQQQQALWILLIVAVIAITTVIGYELYRYFNPSTMFDDSDRILDDVKHTQQMLSCEYLATILRDLNRH